MNWSARLRKLLTLRCEEASLLTSQSRDESLGRWDRLALWGHLLVCGSCRRFRKQIDGLAAYYRLRDASDWGEELPTEGLCDSGRTRIAEALRRAVRDEGQQPSTGEGNSPSD